MSVIVPPMMTHVCVSQGVVVNLLNSHPGFLAHAAHRFTAIGSGANLFQLCSAKSRRFSPLCFMLVTIQILTTISKADDPLWPLLYCFLES